MYCKVEAYDYLKSRNATRLCHFTKVKSLTHILRDDLGIRSTDLINPGVKQQNDKERLDNATDYVCCSLQYPNSWYWRQAKGRDVDKVFQEWVVLSIDLAILKETKCKFCPYNAAVGRGAGISDNLANIYTLFDSPIRGRSRTPRMLDCCPTNDQAEILVHKNIPLNYVNQIIVGDCSTANHIFSILLTTNNNIPVYIAPDVCNTNWSAMVRNGQTPLETQYFHRSE